MAHSNNNEHLMSTGEAARLLDVSRSTVSRRFDKAELRGEANPITGERMISRDSVIELMRGARASLSAGAEGPFGRRVILATSNAGLRRRLEKLASGAAHLRLTSASSGSDALIECARKTPNLLIITDDLHDISCLRVVEALRRRVAQKGLGILCSCDDPEIRKYDVDQAANLARMGNEDMLRRIKALLGIRDHSEEDDSGGGRRRWKRCSVSVPARIGFYRSREPRSHYWGEATVENISHGGAFLNAIRMDSGVIPSEPFRMLLHVSRPPLEDLRATCQVMRLGSNGAVSAGVRFLRVSATGRNKLAELSA